MIRAKFTKYQKIRRFCAELDKSFPYWLYFLSTEDSSLKMMAFCLCRVKKKAPGLAMLGRGALGFFLSSHFSAMNELFAKYFARRTDEPIH